VKRNREAIRTLLGFALVASAGAGLWGCEPPPAPVQEDDEENNADNNTDNNGEENNAQTNNTGACDPACGPNQTCANGVCMDVPPDPNVCNPTCGPNQVCTNNICVDNAPQCNPACSPGYTCNAGVCEPDVIAECNPACGEGYTCVNGTCVSDGPGPGVDCSAYVYRGQTYDCSTLDVCTERDLVFITACATCDPALLDGQANCGPVCGDGLCDSGENSQNCVGDCPPQLAQVESCMRCHNGASEANNYSGPGLSNPHPFAPQANISCTGCHGSAWTGAGEHHLRRLPRWPQQPPAPTTATRRPRLPLRGLHRLPHGATAYDGRQPLDSRPQRQQARAGQPGRHRGPGASPRRDAPDPQRRQDPAQRRLHPRHRDRACVGCHQGSNRTVLQYWGIRLDQNQDLVNNFQYPANPVTFQTPRKTAPVRPRGQQHLQRPQRQPVHPL
jgi:hypothetical protein